MLKEGRAWRGEVSLELDSNTARTLMVRADPVFSTPERILGFVLLFTDVTDRKAAETARRRFQQDLVERPRVAGMRLDSNDHIIYQDLLASLVENAQLAALEITYGADTTRLKGMLDSVRTSIARSSELLQHLIWHASNTSDESDKEH
jgi:hypothetical protein